MHRTLLPFFLTLPLLQNALANPEVWPQFRGPEAGVAEGANLPETWSATQNIAWKTEIPGSGWSSPVVWGNRIFITSVMSAQPPEAPKKGLYFGGNRENIPTDEHRWIVYCLDFQTGKILWQREVHRGVPKSSHHLKNTYASETPVTDGEHLYAYFGNVGLFCLDMDGKLVWKQNWGPFHTRYGWGTAASPVLYENRIYIVSDNDDGSFLLALDKRTGKQIWRVERDEKSNWATPFIWKNERRTEIVTPGTTRIRSYDLDGKALWTLGGMSSIVIPTPFARHGLLYVTSGYVGDERRPAYAIRPGASGEITPTDAKFVAWSHPQAGPYNPSPLVHGDYYYTLLDRGFLTCHDARTGKEIYGKQRIDPAAGAFTASPWAYNGKIFALSEDGDTFVIQAGREFKVLGKNALDEMTMATPAIVRDSLIVRTASKLYRVRNMAMAAASARPLEWPQFRGPNGSGVGEAMNLPVEFGPSKNLVWKLPLPSGHSSPVFGRDRIFLTAVEGKTLLVMALDRASGRVLWKREVPRPREQELHKNNNPASPSPVTDGENVWAFFTDFGLISFDRDGKERWQRPLGPFNNPFGMGASPVLAGNLILQICDAETGSFFVGVDRDTGKLKWRVERPDTTRGFSTPVLYQPEKGNLQALVAGSYRLTAYDATNGEIVWWTSGLTWQLKPTPVMGKGDVLYVLGWAGGSDTGQQEDVPPFEEVLKKWDTNHDGKLSREEVPDRRVTGDWRETDLDNDGVLGERDWQMYRSKRSVQNGMNAFRLGGSGDMTGKSRIWQYTKSLPNAVSPLLYRDVLYMVKEGGILTALDPASGEVLKQGRISGALGYFYSSPVAADGKIYAVSEEGKAAVIEAGKEWKVLAVNDLGEDCHATPAIVDGRLFIRTHQHLYCFAKAEAERK